MGSMVLKKPGACKLPVNWIRPRLHVLHARARASRVRVIAHPGAPLDATRQVRLNVAVQVEFVKAKTLKTRISHFGFKG
jgi:hypothetical protein